MGRIGKPHGVRGWVTVSVTTDEPERRFATGATVLLGAMPFVAIMLLTMVLLAIFPGIATWLPNQMMGG